MYFKYNIIYHYYYLRKLLHYYYFIIISIHQYAITWDMPLFGMVPNLTLR